MLLCSREICGCAICFHRPTSNWRLCRSPWRKHQGKRAPVSWSSWREGRPWSSAHHPTHSHGWGSRGERVEGPALFPARVPTEIARHRATGQSGLWWWPEVTDNGKLGGNLFLAHPYSLAGSLSLVSDLEHRCNPRDGWKLHKVLPSRLRHHMSPEGAEEKSNHVKGSQNEWANELANVHAGYPGGASRESQVGLESTCRGDKSPGNEGDPALTITRKERRGEKGCLGQPCGSALWRGSQKAKPQKQELSRGTSRGHSQSF